MIEVVQPPAMATVQDLGRPGLRAQGVPPGGALDPWALRLANVLVGNRTDTAALEWLLGGGRVRFLKPMPFAFAGAEVVGHLAGRPIASHRRYFARAGDELQVDSVRDGQCLYLACGGGLDVATVLGSASTLVSAGFGGWHGRRLQGGDRLATGRRRWPPPRFAAAWLEGCPWRLEARPLRFIPGPQWDDFAPAWRDAFAAAEFGVGAERDRAGARLRSSLPPPAFDFARPSEPATPGAIQILPTGQPVVLLADGPTVGGYPKIGTIVAADLGRFVQVRPGASVRFAPCPCAAAVTALREAHAWLGRLAERVAGRSPA